MGGPGIVEPKRSQEPTAARERDDEAGVHPEPLLEERREHPLLRRLLEQGGEAEGHEPVREARDVRDLDAQALERRRLPAGAERCQRVELAGPLVVPQDRASIDPDEPRRDPDDRREELVGVRQVPRHLGDAQQRREDLGLVNLVSARHRGSIRTHVIRKFAARYHAVRGPQNSFNAPLRCAVCGVRTDLPRGTGLRVRRRRDRGRLEVRSVDRLDRLHHRRLPPDPSLHPRAPRRMNL